MCEKDQIVDFLQQSLMELLDSNLIVHEKDQIVSLQKELRTLRTFLKVSEAKRYEHEKVKNLVTQITDLAYRADNIIDTVVVSMVMPKKYGHVDRSQILDDLVQEIKSIKTHVMEIYEIGVLQVEKSTDGGSILQTNSPLAGQEMVFGFEDEAMTIIERLTGVQKHLDVISIVGLAGLGKTTLARKVYNDPYVVYHFHIRAWIYVSQVYRKRDLLLNILHFAFKLNNEINKMSDGKLGEELYKRLKGKRYLIVMDDIWKIGAWNDLKFFFPNDNNGSRILFTSRLMEVGFHAKPDSHPHRLRFLTPDESWDLFQYKVFGKENCYSELVDIGKQIARKCQGLPLAIVVVAGFLAKKDKTREWWNQVAESVNSYIVNDPEQYMDTLALSYKHLPCHLKPCFLYFGAFPVHYEIPIWKLIWLWIAEGFIQKSEQKSLEDSERKSLEDVGEEYLMDLIDRSLILVAQRSFNGGIKACGIHDLLRDLCSRQAKEENFLKHIHGYEYAISPSSSSSSSSSSDPMLNNEHRMSIDSHIDEYISSNPYVQHIRSLQCFDLGAETLFPHISSFICQSFKHLRVLDLSWIDLTFFKFPCEIKRLVHLRYLALFSNFFKSLPQSISNLCYLQSLIVKGALGKLVLPYNIWKMVNLRHLYVNGRIYFPRVRKPTHPFMLNNLQTISTLSFSSREDEILVRIPNVKKLRCVIRHWCNQFPKLDFLIHLESINLSYTMPTPAPVRFFALDKFPKSLKKLTLSKFALPWTEISTLGMLPNLEVLKLLYNAFNGPQWDAVDEEFPQLKFLKLQYLNISKWNVSKNHFPKLQRLVLDSCRELEEVPFDLGDIPTLEMIEIYWPSNSAAYSAKQIQEEQQSMGNDGLKILVYPQERKKEGNDEQISKVDM